MTADGVVGEGQTQAHDGSGEECHEDGLLLVVDLHRGPGHEVERESDEGDYTEQVGPDVSRLCVDPEYRLETLLEAGQGRSMALLQEIVIL